MKRRAMGGAILVARLIGLGLIVLSALSLLEMRILAGGFAGTVGVLAALVLGLAGIVWLVAVQTFLHFFDQFLSRN